MIIKKQFSYLNLWIMDGLCNLYMV